ncbi:MAG: CRTAC1 family protein, partial [Phycisphaerae bacterium]
GNDPAPGTAPSWSTGVTWVDVDRDGRLDLFVANYVKWTPETDIFTTLDGKNKSYALPQQYDGQSCRLYRNTGDGRFQDVTSSAGVFNDNGKSLGVVADDFNDDGWPDLFITNDTQPNFLYINNGDGTFVDRAFPAGCGYDDNGRARAGMGVDVADINNDGVRCIAIGNFTGEPVSLYAQIGDGLFQDYAGAARLVRTTLQPLTFGVLFADFDLDGYSDLVIANGHVEPQINTVRKEVTFAQRPMLFHNNRHGQFTDVTDHAGPPFVEPIVGRGVACADYDADGDLDLLITVNGGATKLLRNDTEMDGAHWVKLRLQDTGFNIQAIGAKIVAEVGDLTIRRYLRAGSGYLAQSTTDIVLGLGRHEKIDRLTIHWPDGSRQLLSNVAASTTHRITRAGASAQP